MSKIISSFIASLIITFSLSQVMGTQSVAAVCTCVQDFEDFQGYQINVTVNVICPAYLQESDLNCFSEIANRQFSSICENVETGEATKTSADLNSWTKPVNGFTYCRIRQ